MTPRLDTKTWLLTCCWLSALAGCAASEEPTNVDFGEAKPIGSWHPPTGQMRFETESAEAQPDELSPPQAAAAGAQAVASARTSMGATQPQKPSAPAAGSGGTSAAAPSSSAMTPAAGAPAAAPSSESATAVSSVTFSYTTEAVGGRYRPKNIGAVWVTDSSGKLVKSLEVWARLRLRYLTKYAGVRAGARPDVTATATLTSHKAHMTSWDLKDAQGASVPPGKYTLNAELTDADATGKNISVTFDTSAGPMTVAPPSSAGFTAMELELKLK